MKSRAPENKCSESLLKKEGKNVSGQLRQLGLCQAIKENPHYPRFRSNCKNISKMSRFFFHRTGTIDCIGEPD